jgi:uncharacterized protein YuzE
MKISYDSEIDALYIRLIEGKHECRAVRLNEEIALNIGPDEKLVGNRNTRCHRGIRARTYARCHP